MSIARLDEAIDRVIALASAREDLEPWTTSPVDEAVIERLVWDAAPWHFAEEHLHMARRQGFFPGYRCWGDWEQNFMPPPTIDGQIDWQRRMGERPEYPQTEPTVKWVEYAWEERFFSIVPLLKEPFKTAPIAFTEGIDAIDVVFPSLSALLESFATFVESYGEHYGDRAPIFNEDDGFDQFWWATVDEETATSSPKATAAVIDQVAKLTSADQSEHPVWTQIPRNVPFTDTRLFWI